MNDIGHAQLSIVRQRELVSISRSGFYHQPAGETPEAGVRISLDGRGRWMDKVFIERLWCSLRRVQIYIHASETSLMLRGRADWLDRLRQFTAGAFNAVGADTR